jgi:DNA-directed RNA polymerase specialized sigma24 family protein
MEPVLRASLVRYGLSEHDAEDVVQEVFVRGLAYRPGFPVSRDFVRWATIVARNLGHDRLRELGRVEPAEIDVAPLPDPADEVEQWTAVEAIVRAYETLSEHDRRVLYDAADDQRPDDAGERTRFKVWLSRARARLRGRLGSWVVGVVSRVRGWGDAEVIGSGLGGMLIAIGVATGMTGPMSSSAESLPDVALATSRWEPAAPRRVVLRPPEVNHAVERAARARAARTIQPQEEVAARRVTYERVDVGVPGAGKVGAVDHHAPETEDPPLVCLWNIAGLGSGCLSRK